MSSNQMEQLEKKKLFDAMERNSYNEAIKITETMIQKLGTSETTFRIGFKMLSVLNGIPEKSENFQTIFKMFKMWFNYCFEFDQTLMTKNNIIYFAAMRSKSLISEKFYENAIELLNKLQSIYPFLSENKYDNESERYMKFLAPVCFNPSIKKELMNENIETSLRLFLHGIKFYMKILSPFNTIFDSMKLYEMTLMKMGKFDMFYEDLFEFLYDSLKQIAISTKESTKISSTEKDIEILYDTKSKKSAKKAEPEVVNDKNQTEQRKETIAYIKQNYLGSLIHFMSVCYAHEMSSKRMTMFQEHKVKLERFLSDSSQNCVFDSILINILDLVVTYSNQFGKKKSAVDCSASSSTKRSSTVLQENKLIENKIKSYLKKLTQLLDKFESNKQLGEYYKWNVNNLNELFYSSLGMYINDLNSFGKLMQDTSVELFSQIVNLYVDNSKRLVLESDRSSNASKPEQIKQLKLCCYKPLIFYASVSRLVEQLIKSNNQAKTAHSELLIDSCEQLLLNHFAYLNWIRTTDLLDQEDLGKNYLTLETQSIRTCSQFYSEENILNYIKFQNISLDISIERLSFLFASEKEKTESDLSNIMRNFYSTCENLLLSLRLKEKFDKARDVIRKIYEFLAKSGQEHLHMELLVTNWCKIKRDMWKLKANNDEFQANYETKYKKETIADFVRLDTKCVCQYLLEEIRVYNYFKTIDSSVLMNQEIFYTLSKLQHLDIGDPLIKCRIYLELAEFSLINQKEFQNKFDQSSEAYFDMAKSSLASHVCDKDNMSSLNENKENKEKESKKRISSPLVNLSNSEHSRHLNSSPCQPTTPTNVKQTKSTTTTTTKKRKINRKDALSPVKSDRTSSKRKLDNRTEASSLGNRCECLTSRIISFELILFNMLLDYAKQRDTMSLAMSNLILARMKIKDNTQITTNADNLNLQTISTQCLICPELCDKEALKLTDTHLVKQLDECLNILDTIVKRDDNENGDEDADQNAQLAKSVMSLEKNLLKKFYESIDLLAQLYAFFGLLTQRCKTLRLKLKLLCVARDKQMRLFNNEQIYANTVICLLKAYLNAKMCAEYEQLNKELINEHHSLVPNEPVEVKVTNHVSKECENKTREFTLENLVSTIEKHPYLSSKQETIVSFYLTLAHFFILKQKADVALALINKKVIKSNILSGKQTAFYYEVKYYLRYLQFLLTMIDMGSKGQSELRKQIEHETSLSLIEDCYTSAFSVARYYIQNSIEPSRALNPMVTSLAAQKGASHSTQMANSNENHLIYFNIANSECYRILSECLDIMQQICKYYIEISRYRDAIGYIREGLDITQLHFSNRRVCQFLLHQINADLISMCLQEASSRIKLAEHFIYANDATVSNADLDLDYKQLVNVISQPNSLFQTDLYSLANCAYLIHLNALREVKLMSQLMTTTTTTTTTNQSAECPQPNVEFLHSTSFALIEKLRELDASEYCKDYLIELYFVLVDFFKAQPKSKEPLGKLIYHLKTSLLKPKDPSTRRNHTASMYENWHLAEYYCTLYELDESNASWLQAAYDYVKHNPQPSLYRRICLHMFKAEKEAYQRVNYLLETQSIALRHKACSIQIKHKRKSNIDEHVYEKMIGALSFESTVKKEYLADFITNLIPTQCVVVALVLVDNVDLHVVRLEKGGEPLVYNLKYDQKYSNEFKNIMSENDRSMKQVERSKFWSTRNSLNKRLHVYLDDLERNVFGFAKSLLLGSYANPDLIDETLSLFKKELTIQVLSSGQEKLLRMLIVGLEFLSYDELLNALKTQFAEKDLEKYARFLLYQAKLTLNSHERKHVCLLVDKYLHQIPWECLPCTKVQPMSRMPSIHFLISHIQTNSLQINKDKAFYIVDPGCDLTHTREKFQILFEKRKNWNGIIGVAPNENQFKKALTEYELFIYTGHGSGSQYYPSDDVQKLRVQACSILMGCSSGNQYVMGDFEPYGTVLAYIVAGCPAIVGNLWDVTDRDIDRLTEEFLESWIKEHDESNANNDEAYNKSICFFLNKARKACKMAYLNGSAPIVYGLPVSFK